MARRSAAGLTADDIGALRRVLDGGRRPKVVFAASAGQIAGQFGQVVRMDDPAGTEDWIVVRFGRDELPFSPTDLALPPKGSSRQPRKQESPPPPLAPPINPASTMDGKASTERAAERQKMDSSSAQTGANTTAAPPASRAGRKPKAKSAPGLTVTLSYHDGEWALQASRGTKVAAKHLPVRPAAALEAIAAFGVPEVQAAVDEVVATARAAAEEEAERLRRELAEVEAKLAELHQRG